MKTYRDREECPFCGRETDHEITDSEHERDSSNDFRECLECGALWMGLTGKYAKYVGGVYVQK